MEKLGTFTSCSECKNKNINCCNNFNEIDNPLITTEEYNTIFKRFNKPFCKKVSPNLYTIDINNNNCIFFINNKCTIYDIRPLDCRLFPFDIFKINNKYYLTLYKKPCQIFDNIEKFQKDNSFKIEEIINRLRPYLNEYTSADFCKKLLNKEYIIIKEI